MESISDKTYLENVQTKQTWQSVGCGKCNNTGFKGRIGVYEAIVMDENIERVVKDNPSEREIKKASKPQNLLDIRQDGALKILSGITTLEELERVVDIEKE